MSITRGYIGFARAVEDYEDRILRDVKRVIAETTEIAVSQMKALVAVDTGNTKRSINAQYMNGGLSAIIIVGSSIGIYLEYGTGIYSVTGNGRMTPWTYYKNGRYYTTEGMRAQPFFHPSIEVAREHFEREMNNLGS